MQESVAPFEQGLVQGTPSTPPLQVKTEEVEVNLNVDSPSEDAKASSYSEAGYVSVSRFQTLAKQVVEVTKDIKTANENFETAQTRATYAKLLAESVNLAWKNFRTDLLAIPANLADLGGSTFWEIMYSISRKVEKQGQRSTRL